MSEKRKYQRIAPEHLAYAKRRFQEFASTSAVRAELKAQGGEYSHSQLRYYWHKANEKYKGRLVVKHYKLVDGTNVTATAISADPDPADEANPPKSQAA